jgi:hypothetical protein
MQWECASSRVALANVPGNQENLSRGPSEKTTTQSSLANSICVTPLLTILGLGHLAKTKNQTQKRVI